MLVSDTKTSPSSYCQKVAGLFIEAIEILNESTKLFKYNILFFIHSQTVHAELSGEQHDFAISCISMVCDILI